MTCIIGLVTKNKKVYIGGDSAGVGVSYDVVIRSDEKVFRNGPFIMGFTTSFRMGQLLRYDFSPPEHPHDMEDLKYMVSVFVPNIRKCFKDGGFLTVKDDVVSGGNFIVGYKGNIYEVESDFQVGVPTDKITAVGCGAEVAKGAMFALKNVSPKKRILRALEITSHLNAGVRPPFIIEEL